PLSALAGDPASGVFRTIDVPGSLSEAYLPQIWVRINAEGQIVGAYEDRTGVGHGFILTHGGFFTIDGPGAVFSELNAIGPGGDILGDYLEANSGSLRSFWARENCSRLTFLARSRPPSTRSIQWATSLGTTLLEVAQGTDTYYGKAFLRRLTFPRQALQSRAQST